ncbi:hypothetical protein EYZ11_002822 [Aspergillus tanneri]|uniref:NTP binding protein n=1 Tax=Aspergillus tanneri TaxID=1220188 RepID=A0A4S3JPX8_9EURO|nr:uncharacterized protein ATNIH1004_003325 [Aspergillus tanneri]KAA8650637.1 hypothetical protein ATNIH1004_003325 [Aspergillus tanneri]THC97716.1 hypothetical protein EYZ11_002822 [Aspergillus tanneri]
MEERFNLPDGHILNLQARLRNLKHAKNDAEETECDLAQEPATGTQPCQFPSESRDPKSTPEASLRKVTPTRLPMPKKIADKARGQYTEKSPVAEHGEHSLGRRVRAKVPPIPLERRPAKSADKDREQYWQKVKEKFDRESPRSSRAKDKHKDYYYGAYQKILSLTGSPKQETTRHKLKHVGKDLEKASMQSAIPRSAAVDHNLSCRHDPAPSSKGELSGPSKSRSNKDQRKALETGDAANRRLPERHDTATDSSAHSRLSISPVSGPCSSITEWEDRFVVNMPSAKEPNPPTMSAHQIAEFQRSIDKVHKEGEAMLDPDTLPSPRTTTPEDKFRFPESQARKMGNLDSQDSNAASLAVSDEPMSSQQPSNGRYYCPDEIGKPRFSTIWEESPSRSKCKVATALNIDGSFLGCKEMNGPNDKNPDEILLFSTAGERPVHPRVVDVSTSVPRNLREWKKADPRQATVFDQKTVVQEEWKPISQNLKHAQCSKPSTTTMCRENNCRPPERAEISAPKASGKENTSRTQNLTKVPEQWKCSQEDNVFIITPTIKRTMMSMVDMRGAADRSSAPKEPASQAGGETITDARAKPPTNSTPSGLRRATQTSWGKLNTQYITLSKASPTTNCTAAQNQAEARQNNIEHPHPIRGYIRTTGMVKSSTENHIRRSLNSQQSQVHGAGPDNENVTPMRSVTDPAQFAKSTSAQKPIVPTTSPTGDQQALKATARSARIFEVAELDGQQVDDLKDEPKEQVLRPKSTTTINSSSHNANVEIQETVKDAVVDSVTFGLIIDIIVLSIAQAQGLYDQIIANRNSRTELLKVSLTCILRMAGHCLYVLWNVLTACYVYNTTGSWPRPNEKDLARSLTELGQAVIYLVALGFIMMVVGRAAGYIVLVGSWVVWVTKPFGWILGALGRALLA